MKTSVCITRIWIRILGVATLVVCSPLIATESEVTKSILTAKELGKVVAGLDCSKCMHKASEGDITKPGDVAANCQWLPNAPLIALVSHASEERVVEECLPPPEPFLPKDFDCYAFSRIQFRKQVVLRDDTALTSTDQFRTFYQFGRFAGLMNGIQVLPDHRYLIFSKRDEESSRLSDQYRIKGTDLGPRLGAQYPLRAACDLQQQPSLSELDKSTTDKVTGEARR